MTITDIVLVVFIVTLMAWAVYDAFIIPRRYGETLLTLPLLRPGHADGFIFTALLLILIYHNITYQGTLLTRWLLCILTLMAIYLFWLRAPKITFKKRGLIFATGWVNYDQIKEMNLSGDGVLVMQLEQRRLLIRVKNIDDLEKIYKLLVLTQ